MKKLNVIAPQDSSLVTILQNIDCATGSVAINDEFHDMFVSINGQLVGPLGPGRYSLDSSFSPFFARIRTYPTGGRAAINVTVFYVSRKNYTLPWGTGEITCSEKVLNIPIPVRVAAGGTTIFKVRDSAYFLKCLVGLQGFDVTDLERSARALIIPVIRDAIVSRISSAGFASAQTDMQILSDSIAISVRPSFRDFGLILNRFSITCFNVNPADLAKLQEIHKKRVSKATDLEAAANEIAAIYNGNVYDKARVEALINFSQNQGNSGSMAQMAMLPALWTMSGHLGEELQNAFSRSPQSVDQSCPNCHRSFSPGSNFCPHCGHQIH